MVQNKKEKLAVLVSGVGSLLRAALEIGVPVDVVLADRECPGINGVLLTYPEVKRVRVIRDDFTCTFDRHAYTMKVIEALKAEGVTVIAMAGFMTIFAPVMFEHFGGRILNIHPSLLPLYKGEKAVEDALAAGATETGTTVHIATEKLDDETHILAQEKVPVIHGDTVEMLWNRIKKRERKLYPRVMREFMEKIAAEDGN